ncbi:MAG TPA: Rne/Rng family ribonuclease [Deltaproteobacteria bacterium]|nr:MAG: ribonuclease G [Deltaproteobacteria bacterium GWD2_42_10]OGP48743.1 MAG: ribonuclease G [Deltaproteobacteria bacterium GWF2_42_12]OGQ35257.1 MAG: ribonuclease G [Deltaproteobacteria bacterium RIFCSPLOWO2_02_FULL_42_39]HAG51903.1 Rne/Rng family ribonuclease [Deltaproteobacteria bacterium]
MKRSGNEIIINYNPHEARVALLQGSRLVEFYLERSRDRGLSGNVYKGKVVRVLPGMQAAFVDIGLERTAFLHVTDIYKVFDEFEDIASEAEETRERPSRHAPIQDVLKEGQELMVQVAKEPMGSKGARITSHVSLPGRYIVFTPTDDHIGVSRRIENEKERRRLKDIVVGLRPPGAGFIIRTACEGMKEDDIKSDMDFLIKLWGEILKKREKLSAPYLLYQEPDLTLRTIRDIFTADIDKLIIDDRAEYERAIRFAEDFLPELRERIELYESHEPIFDAYGIEIELADASSKKVWLKSGGYIVIDQMEALTAIDVNTGKYVGKKSSEETVLKTNMEAVKEVVYQLKLRNIGGIVVIDFIDMAKAGNREKVYSAFKEALKADKARTNILKISELGLIEMTRKRSRESINQMLCEPCPYCEGNGIIRSKDTVIMEIYRELIKELPKRRRKLTLYVHPVIAELLYGESEQIIEELEKSFKKKVVIKTVNSLHQEQYEVV